jgi:hypothetical protein
MTIENIGLATFQRAGFTSFMPDVIDNFAGVSGFGSIFGSNFRTSSLQTASPTFEGLTSNPTVDAFNRASKTTANIVSSIVQGRLPTQAEVRTATPLVPLSKVFGLSNTIEVITQKFPKRKSR